MNVAEVLGIGYEDIDVFGKAVLVFAHQHRAAAEGPVILRLAIGRQLVNDIQGMPKKRLPRLEAVNGHGANLSLVPICAAIDSRFLRIFGKFVDAPKA